MLLLISPVYVKVKMLTSSIKKSFKVSFSQNTGARNKTIEKPGLFVKGQRKLDKLISKVKKVFA
ncbi:MAG: hypothetical protein N5P05_001839 [Chroococcopsis gigantea SAG 12.99]|nr:hypothetical protein [Chroococcopsis gigantea SAG 12.99]